MERGQGKHPVVNCRVAAFLIRFLGVSREDHDFEGFTFEVLKCMLSWDMNILAHSS